MVPARSVARQVSNKGRRVAVFGATGHTGRFVVSELLRRGIEPVAVARNRSKSAELRFEDRSIEIREASIDDAGSLDRAFTRVAAVINCAGPFLDTAEAVAAAALRAHAHYLDVTAEQPSARATFERFDRPARDAGVVVIPAMGFYGGFADLLVTAAMGDWSIADEIRIGIALDSWHPTQGTRITGERNTARRMVVADGRFAPLPQPAAETTWDFPQPFARQTVIELPFSEVVVIAHHVRTVALHTYLSQTALRDVRDATTPPPVPADETGRSAQRFAVEAIMRKDDEARRAIAQGRDIYAFTAPLVGEAVERLLRGDFRDAGAQAPGAIFDARDFLQALVPDTVRVSVSEFMGVEIMPLMLARLREAHPGIRTELSLSNSAADLLAQEVDIAVRTVAPRQAALVARKVVSIPLGLFAARSYVERRGLPVDLAELSGHDFVGPDRDRTDLALAEAIGAGLPRAGFVLRTDSHPAQLAAARSGLGIVITQCPLAESDPTLVRILPELEVAALDTWIVTHENLARIPRVRAVFDSLVESFTAMRHRR